MRKKISINSVKNQNRHLVFQQIINNDMMPRIEITRETNLSLGTVSTIIEELSQTGVIEEIKDNHATVGRKPKLVHFIPESKRIICVDLSKKNFLYEIRKMDLSLEESKHYIYDDSKSYADNVSILVDRVKELEDQIRQRDIEVLGVGISVPGPYRDTEDKVISWTAPEMSEIRIKQIFTSKIKCPIFVEHDVCLAAKAEVQDTDSLDSKIVFVIYVGHGVGGALSIDDEVYTGAGGYAGEIGQLIIEDGHNLEQLISWENLIGCIDYDASSTDDISLQKLLVNKYQEGDSTLTGYIEKVTDYLGTAISNITWIFNPNKIVLCGYYNIFGDKFISKIRKNANKNLLPDIVNNLEIRYSNFNESITNIGACSLVREQWLNKL